MSVEKALFSLDVMESLIASHYGKELADKLLVPIREELSAIKPQRVVHKPAVNPVSLEQSEPTTVDTSELITMKEVIRKSGVPRTYVVNWANRHSNELRIVGCKRLWPEDAEKKLVESWDTKGRFRVKKVEKTEKELKVRPLTEEEASGMNLSEKQRKALEIIRNPELMKKSVEELAWKMSMQMTPSQA